MGSAQVILSLIQLTQLKLNTSYRCGMVYPGINVWCDIWGALADHLVRFVGSRPAK